MKSVREIFAENLLELIESKKIDQRDLAIYLGVSDSAISHWIKGNKYPRIDKIQKMADFFNVPKSRLTEVKPENLEEVTPIFVKIPILGEIACGDPLIIEEQSSGYMWELKDGLPHGELFALKTKGDSMEPTIPDGVKVLVRHQEDVENGEIAAVLINDDTEATLKRVKKQGDLVMLVPDNPKHEIIIVNENNPARIIGKVVRAIRDFI